MLKPTSPLPSFTSRTWAISLPISLCSGTLTLVSPIPRSIYLVPEKGRKGKRNSHAAGRRHQPYESLVATTPTASYAGDWTPKQPDGPFRAQRIGQPVRAYDESCVRHLPHHGCACLKVSSARKTVGRLRDSRPDLPQFPTKVAGEQAPPRPAHSQA